MKIKLVDEEDIMELRDSSFCGDNVLSYFPKKELEHNTMTVNLQMH